MMTETALARRFLSCSCGGVTIEATGAPIAVAACHCDDCQRGARQLEALPGAGAVCDAAGGTGYVLYRRDRVTCIAGAHLLRGYKIRPHSPTNRMVASCCNTPMLVSFDKGPHWVSLYRARFGTAAPQLQWRVCTKFMPEGAVLPGDAPDYRMYPPAMVARLVGSRLAMALGR
jgi:hypothetical protein